MQSVWKLYLILLFLVATLVWLAVFSASNKNFRIIACDVGQGDAILATYGSTQILTDAGSGRKVIDCLSRHMPFWDRQIELVILTHPDSDHSGGLVEVFQKYSVINFINSGLDSGSREFEVLKNLVGSEGANAKWAEEGSRYRLGKIYLDIVYPPKEKVAKSALFDDEAGDLFDYELDEGRNNLSLVYVLSFGEFNTLMTGDIEDAVSDEVAGVIDSDFEHLSFEYIKIPHHGSKNGLSEKLLESADPKIAVISAGKNNSYGHPHSEVIKLLNDMEVAILRTDQLGDVVVESDGERFWVRP